MAVLSHQANVYWYVQYDKLWIQAYSLARIARGPKMTVPQIQASFRYYSAHKDISIYNSGHSASVHIYVI